MTKIVILSIDDNPADQNLIAMALEETGRDTELQRAESVDAALALLGQLGNLPEARRPNLILLDLNLPKMNGMELVEEIRRTQGLEATPIVIFTGAKPSHTARDEAEETTSVYLVKPDEIREYFAIVRLVEEYACAVSESPRDMERHTAVLKQSIAQSSPKANGWAMDH